MELTFQWGETADKTVTKQNINDLLNACCEPPTVLLFVGWLVLTRLDAQCGVQTHDPEIKIHMPH